MPGPACTARSLARKVLLGQVSPHSSSPLPGVLQLLAALLSVRYMTVSILTDVYAVRIRAGHTTIVGLLFSQT